MKIKIYLIAIVAITLAGFSSSVSAQLAPPSGGLVPSNDPVNVGNVQCDGCSKAKNEQLIISTILNTYDGRRGMYYFNILDFKDGDGIRYVVQRETAYGQPPFRFFETSLPADVATDFKNAKLAKADVEAFVRDIDIPINVSRSAIDGIMDASVQQDIEEYTLRKLRPYQKFQLWLALMLEDLKVFDLHIEISFQNLSSAWYKVSKDDDGNYELTYIPGSSRDKHGNTLPDSKNGMIGNFDISGESAWMDFLILAEFYGIPVVDGGGLFEKPIEMECRDVVGGIQCWPKDSSGPI